MQTEHRLVYCLAKPFDDGTEQWLTNRRGSKVEVRNPRRGDLVTLQKLAQENAKIQIKRLVNRTSGSLEQRAADGNGAVTRTGTTQSHRLFRYGTIAGR